MRIPHRVLIAILALAVVLPLSLAAQNAPTAPAPPTQKKPTEMTHHVHHQQAMGKPPGREQGWGGGRHMGMHRRHRRGGQQFMLARLVSNPALRERLGISPEQALKIRTQVSDYRKAEIRNRADAEVKHLELADLLSADKPDRSAIDKKLEELSAVRLAGAKSAINFRLDMRQALTAEQQEKLQQMRHDFFHQGGFDHHGPHGPKGNMPPSGSAGEL